MSRIVEFFLNDKKVEISSTATASVLEACIMTDDILSDALHNALERKAIPANPQKDDAGNDKAQPLREFFPAQFFEGKNPDDVFRCVITHSENHYFIGEGTRRKIYNRLLVASNSEAYTMTVERHVPVTAEGKTPKGKAVQKADNL